MAAVSGPRSTSRTERPLAARLGADGDTGGPGAHHDEIEQLRSSYRSSDTGDPRAHALPAGLQDTRRRWRRTNRRWPPRPPAAAPPPLPAARRSPTRGYTRCRGSRRCGAGGGRSGGPVRPARSGGRRSRRLRRAPPWRARPVPAPPAPGGPQPLLVVDSVGRPVSAASSGRLGVTRVASGTSSVEQRRDGVLAQQPVAALGDHHRIEDDGDAPRRGGRNGRAGGPPRRARSPRSPACRS